MNDETPNGVLLKAADGSHYFIPASELSKYQAAHVTDDQRDEFGKTAERLEAYSIDASNSDAAVAIGIGFGG